MRYVHVHVCLHASLAGLLEWGGPVHKPVLQRRHAYVVYDHTRLAPPFQVQPTCLIPRQQALALDLMWDGEPVWRLSFRPTRYLLPVNVEL